MLKKRRLFWLGILLPLLAVIGWGYYQFQRPHQSAAGETAAARIVADSLYSQYAADEKACDGKYLGKVIAVTGKLAEIQKNGAAEIWILSTAPGSAGGINCQLFPGENLPEPRPKPGEQVTLKGRCTGYLMDVNLSDCIIEK